MPVLHVVLLVVAGLIAGFIDSIAGGGGLITLPSLSIVGGPGVGAVATNKVAATVGSLIALIVYMKNGHLNLRGNVGFAVATGFAACLGSLAAPLFGPQFFKWLLIVICPVMLWIVWNKNLWLKAHAQDPAFDPTSKRGVGSDGRARSLKAQLVLWIAGLVCGFYDGIAGPGGGTLMFLSLLIFAKLPLLPALATAKFANLASASVSLLSYSHQGLIVWNQGFALSAGMTIGAFVGAEIASARAAQSARMALLIVVSLLMLRLASMN